MKHREGVLSHKHTTGSVISGSEADHCGSKTFLEMEDSWKLNPGPYIC